MENTNINWVAMSDKAIVEAIGAFLKHKRLNQNKTQAQIAEDAGLNRWTLSQIENGEAISMTSFIQILRALDQLNLLDIFKIETQISPIELAKIEQEKRQRARNKKVDNKPDSDW
jgi:transcriptional regulator with XRE-family HTH domain